MHRKLMRMSAVTAGVAALSAAAVTGGYAADAAPAGPQAASAAQGGSPSHSAAIPGAQLWVKRYNGPANGPDQALSAAVSPDGVRVFVTGFSHGAGSKADYATIAYRAGTGTRLWASRYNGPGNGTDLASSVAVSPDGDRVFVTGFSHGTKSGPDYATIAYRAGTGTRLWVRRYNGPGNGTDRAMSVTVSRSGDRVFVTGVSHGAGSGTDYATIAYRAGTGTRLWVRRYNGPGNGTDRAMSVTASPAGNRVFVTGHSTGAGSGLDYATIAYRAATGTRLWVQRYNGPGNGPDGAMSVAASPAGDRVFVTGHSTGALGAGLRHCRLPRRHRHPAVDRAVQRPGQERGRRPVGRGEPRRAHRVRNGNQLRPRHRRQRLRHRRLPRRHRRAPVGQPL